MSQHLTTSNVLQSAIQAQIQAWTMEIKTLKAKLHSATPMQKLEYYEQIKALRAEIAAARSKTETRK